MVNILIVAFFCLFLGVTGTSSSSTAITLPLTTSQGPNFFGAQAKFGFRVASAGDINGDGFDDILIGSPHEYSTNGAVYVIYGGPGKQSDLDVIGLINLAANKRGFIIKGFSFSQLGTSVNYAGDVNGDGHGDIIIGAPYYSTDCGAVYIIFGKKGDFTDFDLNVKDVTELGGFRIVGPSGSYIGKSVSRAGNLDKDAYDDFIIGASDYNSLAGAAYVFFGSSTLTNTVINDILPFYSTGLGFRVSGGTSSKLGLSVSSAGDINDDGHSDIIIGAPNFNSGGGYVAVFFGNSRVLLTDILVYPGASMPANRGFLIDTSFPCQFGQSVSGAGDVNGDDIDDIIIGGPNADFPGTTDSGAAIIIYGKSGYFSDITVDEFFSNTDGFRITGGVSDTFLGSSIGYAGDVNADGKDDILLGGSGLSGSPYGSVFLIYGSKSLINMDLLTPTNLDTTKGIVINPVLSTQWVSSAGDFNGDRGSDILFGSTNISTSLGTAYVFYGTPNPKSPVPPNLPGSSGSSGSQTLEASEISTLNTITQALSAVSKAVGAAIVSISIINFSNPATAILGALSESIYFIKYLRINYPPKLQFILDNYQAEDVITIEDISSAPEDLVNKINRYPLPEKFEKYSDTDSFHSSFLVNFWPSLLNLSFLCVIVIMTFVLKPCSAASRDNGKPGKFIKGIFTRLTQIVKWNLILSKFTGYYGDISLFTSLELRTVHFDSILEVMSFSLCILVTLVLLIIQIKTILVLSELQKAKIRSKQKKNFEILERTRHKFQDYEIIFEKFKDGSIFQQSFLFFFNIRIYLFYAVISWLDHAFVQTSINTTMSLLMLLYLAISRPLREKLELVQYIVVEVVFLIVNVCTLALAVLDFYEYDAEETRRMFGEVILFCNTAFMGLAVFVLFVSVVINLTKLFQVLRQVYRKRQMQQIKQRTAGSDQTNDIDASTIGLNLQNTSQFMDISQKNENIQVRRARQIPFKTPDSPDSSIRIQTSLPAKNHPSAQQVPFEKWNNTSSLKGVQPPPKARIRNTKIPLSVHSPEFLRQQMIRKRDDRASMLPRSYNI